MTSFPEGKTATPYHNLLEQREYQLHLSKKRKKEKKVAVPHCGLKDGYFKAQSLLIKADAGGLFHWRNIHQSVVSIAFVCSGLTEDQQVDSRR